MLFVECTFANKSMALSEKINEELKIAMKARDQGRLRALRAIKSAILIASTRDGSKTVDEEAELDILQKLAKQRKESLETYEKQGREDLASEEREELEVIESFLPEQMSEEKIKVEVRKIIDQTGASQTSDLGKVMGQATKLLKGKADNKTVARVAREMLS